jgi:hypothetical protein
MAKSRVITYECEECGSEIVVTPTGETILSPIYCCGMEVTDISSSVLKKAVKKPSKNVLKKKASTKKKPAAKKRVTKK